MNKKVFTYSFSIIILSLLMLIAVIIVRPIISHVTGEFERMQDHYTSLIEDTVGLKVSYTSLSPSIFSAFRMVDITIQDSENETSLLSIDSIVIRWNIFKLLGDSPTDALGQLVITGLQADYNYLEHNNVIEKLLQFLQDNSSSEVPIQDTPTITLEIPDEQVRNQDIQERIQKSLEPIFLLPIGVRLKNTLLKFTSESLEAEVGFSNIEISDHEETGDLNIELDGRVLVKSTSDDFIQGSLATRVSLKGRLSPILESSFAQMRIFSLRDSDYIVPRLDLHASFSNSALKAIAIQNEQPFTIEVLTDFLTNDLSVELYAEGFDPFSLVAFESEIEVLENLKGTSLFGSYNLTYNWQEESLGYSVDGRAQLSQELLNQEASLLFSVEGNTNEVIINNFRVQSQLLNARYIGSVNLQTFSPQGTVSVFSYTAPSGNTLSSEIYIDSYSNIVSVSSPELLFNEKLINDLQITAQRNDESIDFNVAFSDFSRTTTEDNSAGVFIANGSYDYAEQKFFQIEVISENIFLSSLVEFALWYLPPEQAQALQILPSTLEPYELSLNAFFSSDLSTFSYSVPYAIIANSTREDEFLIFSANGNESLFQIPNFNLLVAGQSIQGELGGDVGVGSSEIFFNSALFLNSYPYSFSGVYVPAESITISGDYDFSVSVSLLENLAFEAYAQTQALPLSINNDLFSLSFNSTLVYNTQADWEAALSNFEFENISSTSAFKPRFSLSGSINSDGAFFDSVNYSDEYSSLTGIIASSWNINEGNPENITLNIDVQDVFSSEKYILNLEAFNIGTNANTQGSILQNMFFSADALVQDAPSGRFVQFQTDSNLINAALTAQGSLENPTFNLSVESASFLLANKKTEVSGVVSLDDGFLSANNVTVSHGTMNFENFTGNVSLNDLSGTITGLVQGSLAPDPNFIDKTFSSPISISLSQLNANEDVPFNEKSFQLEVLFERLEASFFPTMENYAINLLRTPGRYDLQAGVDSELEGYYLETGEISLSAKEGFFVQFDGFGIYENDELTMFFDNMYADASDFSALVDLPVFTLHSGIVEGSGTLTGTLADLQINADLLGENMEISVPDYVNERLIAKTFPVSVSQNIFSATNAQFIAQETDTGVDLTIDMSLEQLMFTYILLDLNTVNDGFVLGRYAMPNGTFEGYASVDMDIYVDNEIIDVKGTIDTQEVEAIISLVQNEELQGQPIQDIVVDLVIDVGNQAQLYLPSKSNPLIRGLVSQEEPLIIQMDTRFGTSTIAGEFTMRGGEILYLNRTFLARDARAVLNESVDSFDPRLTASAEIRERDEDGDTIRILLSVVDQPLSQLDPTFESVPSMSEQEIMTLLGQIFIGQTEDANPLALLGGLADYGTQIIVFRNFENQVRDVLNLDLFSFRTMFLQNTIGYALENSGNSALTVGDFLDGTTVYVGKYLNETLYADALLSVVFDEDRQDLGLGGLVFQPEFGLELPSPIGMIRWSIAPDLTTDWNLLVPFTSVSFSWQFNF